MCKSRTWVVLFLLSAAMFGRSSISIFAETVKIPVARDTWFSSHPGETEGSNGGSPRVKLKGYQEFTLLDFDAAKFESIRGRVIEKATLHVKLASEERLHRVSVSSFASEWIEGKASSYAKEPGSSSFRWKSYPDVPWTIPDGIDGYSDATSVMCGEGGTIWNFADASDPNDSWQTIAVDPKVVAARIAGLSYGFLVFDDTGTELVRDEGGKGENVTIRLFPNRFFFSKDQNASVAPYLVLELGEKDEIAPEAATEFKVVTDRLPPGEAVVFWKVPQDKGGAGILGFFIELDGQKLPQSLAPSPIGGKQPGMAEDNKVGSILERVSIPIRGLNLKPSQKVRLGVKAVDAAGNLGAEKVFEFQVSGEQYTKLPDTSPKPFVSKPGLTLPRLKNAQIAVIDELDKITEAGKTVSGDAESYFLANHIWTADGNRVRLAGARGEFIGFQVYIKGSPGVVVPDLKFDGPDEGIKVKFYKFGHVDSERGKIPDPMIPLDAKGLEISAQDSIVCEIYVPKDASPGTTTGTLNLVAGNETLNLNVSLSVWNFVIPDELAFLPEMNCYNLPENERDYYRLAQEHRTYLNRVPYSHRGTVSGGCAPKWDAESETFDWTAWDKRFSQYFDGSAFADLPRGDVPIEAFYLPLFENFPVDIFKDYNGSHWADEAFPESYGKTFVKASKEFANHFDEKKYLRTVFQFYLNNKMDYKRNGWSRASSPWLLDEPASFQDFWALRFYGKLFHEGVANCDSQMLYRGDISRPQWQRDSLDRVLNVNIVGGDTFKNYNRMILDRKERFGQILYTYGTTCPPEDGAYQPLAWSLDSWTLGADGIVPWQTVGNADSWKRSDELSLFYPGDAIGQKEPLASQRLKSYRRGQQDVEYLVLLMNKLDRPHWDIAAAIRGELDLTGTRTATHSEDAGTIRYGNLRPEDFWRLRIRIGCFLSQ